MISNIVRQGFDSIQIDLYTQQMNRSNSDPRNLILPFEKRPDEFIVATNKAPIMSRLAGIPISIIDCSIECVRPVFLAAESAALVAISLLAVLFNTIRFDFGAAGQSLRLTVLNLHNTIENIVLVPLRVIMAPIFMVAQMLRFCIDPQRIQPTYTLVAVMDRPKPNQDKKVRFDSIMHIFYDLIEETRYNRVNEYAGRGFSEKHPIAGRFNAVIHAIADPFISVLNPLLGTITNVFLSIFLFGLAVLTRAKGGADAKDSLQFFKLALTAMKPDTIAQTITKIVMFPITLLAQVGAALYDPETIRSSSAWLYQEQIFDRRLTIQVQTKATNNNCTDEDWRPASEVLIPSMNLNLQQDDYGNYQINRNNRRGERQDHMQSDQRVAYTAVTNSNGNNYNNNNSSNYY